jgi:hypothetical protein
MRAACAFTCARVIPAMTVLLSHAPACMCVRRVPRGGGGGAWCSRREITITCRRGGSSSRRQQRCARAPVRAGRVYTCAMRVRLPACTQAHGRASRGVILMLPTRVRALANQPSRACEEPEFARRLPRGLLCAGVRGGYTQPLPALDTPFVKAAPTRVKTV